MPELLRDLHTLKGSARSAGLKAFATQAHKAEDALEHAGTASEEANNEIKRTVDTHVEYGKIYQKIFAGSEKNAGDKSFLTVIAAALSAHKMSNQDVVTLIQDFNDEKICDVAAQFLSFETATAELAGELGKKITFQRPDQTLYLALAARSVLT